MHFILFTHRRWNILFTAISTSALVNYIVYSNFNVINFNGTWLKAIIFLTETKCPLYITSKLFFLLYFCCLVYWVHDFETLLVLSDWRDFNLAIILACFSLVWFNTLTSLSSFLHLHDSSWSCASSFCFVKKDWWLTSVSFIVKCPVVLWTFFPN